MKSPCTLVMALCLAAAAFPLFPAFGQRPEEERGKLQFVLIVARHGVRSPTGSAEQLNKFSAQPWPKWDVPPGDLTPRGAALMTIFGAYYRSYYSQQGLLQASGCADSARVSFYSDSDQRTVETGKSLAKGMFPGCAGSEPAQSQSDPLFHSLAAGIGELDRARALAAIAGRIGSDPAALTEAYRPQLERLQQILLGCAEPGACPVAEHTRRLLEIPATLQEGTGDHAAELKGPLATASTFTENFVLEYADGMPADTVGWGRVDLDTLKQLVPLHTAASDLTRRSSYLAMSNASNLLAHIDDTLEQAVTGKEVAGALGKLGDRAVILVGHDTNLANIAGALNLNWLLDGLRDDTPPGGALLFELWSRGKGSHAEVRLSYTSQTLEQMRTVTVLTLQTPPARANIFVPGCSTGGQGFPCEWPAFQQTLNRVIDPAFVK